LELLDGGLGSSSAITMSIGDGSAWALFRRAGGGVTVWTWSTDGSEAPSLYSELAEDWTTLAAYKSEVYVARVAGDELVLAALRDASDGDPVEIVQSYVLDEPRSVVLRPAVDAIYAVLTGSEDVLLNELLNDTGVAGSLQAEQSIQGPATIESRDWFLADGELVVVRADMVGHPAGQPPYSCISGTGQGYLCQIDALYLFDDVSVDSEPVLTLFDLVGPVSWVDAQQEVACNADWLDFGGHAGALEQGADTGSSTPPSEPEGCSAAGTRGDGSLGALIVLAVLVVRRRNA
ncbi:MAG: hypothetical protein KC561_20280, partial [Myxococcales bacterium]|nr:hypothetical protein [Myxococcales bacterium]